MWAQHEAIISRKEFADAIGTRRMPKRTRVAGARSQVPTDVQLYAEGATLVVDTPYMAIPLPMEGQWGVRISVPQVALVLVAPKLGRKRQVSLRYAVNSLIINGGVFVLPATVKRG